MSSRLRLFLIPASRLTGASTHTERTVNAVDTSLGKSLPPNPFRQRERPDRGGGRPFRRKGRKFRVAR